MFSEKTAVESQEYAESIINTIREPLVVLDQDLRVISASRSFYEFFKVNPAETVGQLIYDLGNKQWNIPQLRELLENILPQKTSFDNFEVEHDFDTIGRRILLLNARQIQRALGKEHIILLAIEDITRHKEEEEIRKYALKLKSSNEDLQQFANIASHDLQEPLRMVVSYLQLIEQRYKGKLDQDADEFINFAVDGATRMQGLIDGLLLFSRVESQAKPLELVDTEEVLKGALANLKLAILENKAVITHRSFASGHGRPLPASSGFAESHCQLHQVLRRTGTVCSSFCGEKGKRGCFFHQGQWYRNRTPV